MVRVGFEVDLLDRIEIYCAPANPASAAVARKLGFTHEATLRDRFIDANGEMRDSMVWTMFADGYSGCPASSYAVSAYGCAGDKLL